MFQSVSVSFSDLTMVVSPWRHTFHNNTAYRTIDKEAFVSVGAYGKPIHPVDTSHVRSPLTSCLRHSNLCGMRAPTSPAKLTVIVYMTTTPIDWNNFKLIQQTDDGDHD